jgi:hypothetical protein
LRTVNTLLTASIVFVSSVAFAQQTPATPKPAPDVLIFTNGDQLTGKLTSSVGGKILFHSDMAGDLTIPFDKIRELRSGSNPDQFAVLRKGAPVNKSTPAPEGTISIADAHIVVTPTQPAVSNSSSVSEAAIVPVAQVDLLVSRAEFDKQVHGHESFLAGWNGTVNGGATVVRSTTAATTLTAGLSLTRSMPTVAWLPPRNRTTLNVAESYGKNTSPGAIPQTNPPTPSVTTLSSIFHTDAERDQYVSPRFYALADTSFDHNYAQGLSLQQVYGGGLGWTALKTPHQELDLKADIHYEMQQYLTTPVNGVTPAAQPSTHLVGSTIFEGYHRDLPRKVLFTESLNVLPAFNVASDYSYNATAGLAIPVFKKLSASITATDNFLNDPAPGYKKNSFQFITGVTYAFATKP